MTVTYQTLDVLEEHGIAANDIQKLNDAGYHTVEAVAHATTRKLAEVKGISEAKVSKLKDIVKGLVPMDFKTAADALEDRKSLVTLTTGAIELDKLLEGGKFSSCLFSSCLSNIMPTITNCLQSSCYSFVE